MRRVIASLIVSGALAGSAVAQQPATSAAPPAADPNAAAAPAYARPVPTYPVAEPQVAVQDPAWRLFPPAPVEPIVMPPAPTDQNALQVLSVLDRVCVPAVQGGAVEQLAPAAGMAKRKDVFQMGLQKPYSISVIPLGSNKNVCTITVEYAIDGAAPLREAVAYWALTKQPQMVPYRKRDKFDSDFTRYTSSWEDVRADGSSKGVVFVELKKLNGQPVSRNTDRIQVLYSERK